MEPFLPTLAEHLLRAHGRDLHRVAVVLPSRRAGIHLRRHLATKAGGPLWSPDLHTTGSFQEQVGGMRTAETTTLLLHLLHSLSEVADAGSHGTEIGDLLQWGPVTLQDMSEVDAHMIHLESFYKDLRAYHEIDAWSFRLEELSLGQQSLMRQWRYTGQLHRHFDKRARSMGEGTAGLVARVAAEAGATPCMDKWDHVCFAGLNAIDPAMASLIDACLGTGRASVAWDADEALLSDHGQRAGNLARRNIARFGPGVVPPVRGLAHMERRITVAALPNAVAQARHAAGIVAGMPPEERARTAVVIAREDLLMPLLEALPPHIGPVNVTMEPPLRMLPALGLVAVFLRMHREAPRSGMLRKEHVVRFLEHTLLSRDKAVAGLLERIRSLPGSRVSPVQLFPQGSDPEMLPLLAATKQEELFNALATLLQRVHGDWPEDIPLREQLLRISTATRQFQDLLQACQEPLPISTVIGLLDRHLRACRISLRGEPLSGLQIMGVLETRSIHPGRVLILSANEGVLPPSEGAQSFIPFDIRRHHGLPLHQASEELSALHFMQLFMHCGEAIIMHHGDPEGGSGPSPHITQLARLLENAPTHWQHIGVRTGHLPRTSASLVQAKDAAYLATVAAIAAKGFSPSAMATYLGCPMDFHMRYVLRLQEPEQAPDALGHDVLGQAVHEAMQHSLAPWVGKPMDPEAFKDAAEKVPGLLEVALKTLRPELDLQRGLSHLKLGMAAQAARNHLLHQAREMEGHDITLLAMEEALMASMDLPGFGNVVVRGRADRIDLRDGVKRVLDLKTGAVNDRDLKLGDLAPGSLARRHRHALQLLTYAWMMLHGDPHLEAVEAGIAPLQRSSTSEPVLLHIGGHARITRAQMPAIEELLRHLLGRIMSTDEPLQHHPESSWCKFCAEAL